METKTMSERIEAALKRADESVKGLTVNELAALSEEAYQWATANQLPETKFPKFPKVTTTYE